MSTTEADALFIVFEGGEGAGKSTQAALLAEQLQLAGYRPVRTREPGGTPVAEAIRELVLNPPAPMSDRCEALLFAAARADHAHQFIYPHLQAGDVVISDRYLDSSLAYQGAARGLDVADIADLSTWATVDLVADLTIVLDVDPRAGLARAQDGNRMESEALAFHDTVRNAFLTFAAREPTRYLVVDGTGSIATIAAAIWAEVRRRLPEPRPIP